MLQPTERRKNKNVLQGSEVRIKREVIIIRKEKEIWRRRKPKSQTNKLGSFLGIENPKNKLPGLLNRLSRDLPIYLLHICR